jgi:hypothetical protein
MPVYPHMIVLARRVTTTREYFDLAIVPGSQPIYGVFSQLEAGDGLWREQFSEAEALARLLAWDNPAPRYDRPRLPYSAISPEGQRWVDTGVPLGS